MICFNIDFQRSKGGLTFSEKYYNFTYVSSEMYLLTNVAREVLQLFITIKIKNILLQLVDKM